MAGLLGDIGTIEWLERTRGILNRRERARFFAATALRTSRLTPRMVGMRLGLRGSGPDPSELTLPDTADTRHILEACSELDPMLIEHGYRTYLFGKALGIVCDDEALFAVAFLHDYGLSMVESLTDRDFTLAGIEVAREVLASTSFSERERRDVADAITLHYNPSVRRRRGDLQYLMHESIHLDCFGFRAWDLDPEGIDRVVDRHPRHGFIVRTKPMMQLHARQVRGCRALPLILGGIGPMIPLGPWPRVESAEDRAREKVVGAAGPSEEGMRS